MKKATINDLIELLERIGKGEAVSFGFQLHEMLQSMLSGFGDSAGMTRNAARNAADFLKRFRDTYHE